MARGTNNQGTPPTLAEAWTTLGQRLGLAVEVHGPRHITANGTIRGRSVSVSIEAKQGGAFLQEFLRGFARAGSRNRRSSGKVKWHTELNVGCANPQHVQGTIESAVDVNDPGWKPGEYHPRNGRHVRADSPALAARAITPAVHEQLMSIVLDACITVDPTAIRIIQDGTSGLDGNMVAGSLIHLYQGDAPPWPERALVGPPWWIDLLCDIADAVDA